MTTYFAVSLRHRPIGTGTAQTLLHENETSRGEGISGVTSTTTPYMHDDCLLPTTVYLFLIESPYDPSVFVKIHCCIVFCICGIVSVSYGKMQVSARSSWYVNDGEEVLRRALPGSLHTGLESKTLKTTESGLLYVEEEKMIIVG